MGFDWRRERDSNPCEIALKRFSRPPRYDHFDIPPYKRNYEIVLEKTLEEKTLLSEKCVCFPQIRGFFADCFHCGKEVSRPPRYDHFDIPPYKRNYEIVLEKTLEEKTLLSEKCACLPQIQGFFADCFRYGKEVSRPPRYDRFDTSPYMNCQKADFIGYSIVLEIFLEMRFCVVVGVPKKPVFTRLFDLFATELLANFQAHFVPVTPHFNNKKHLKVERCRKNQHQYHTIGM